MTTTAVSQPRRWPLSRILMLLLAGAFSGLMADVRVEHVDVVHDHAIAWTPIVYGGVMALVCLITAILWNDLTRRIAIVLFVVGIAVGCTGFYLHNHGKFAKVMRTSVRAWTDPEMKHSDAPPQTAPLAFAGLGVLGVLTSLKRFSA